MLKLNKKRTQGCPHRALKPYTDMLVENWIPGQRHKLAWAYVSDLHRAGCSLDGALLMIKEVIERTGDEEPKDRVRVVRDVFSGKARPAPEGYINRMLGISLEEAREAAFLDMSPQMQFVFWRFITGYYCVGKRCADYQNCPNPFARDAKKGKRGKGLLR